MYLQTHDPDVYKPELVIAIRREMAEMAYLMHQVEKVNYSSTVNSQILGSL